MIEKSNIIIHKTLNLQEYYTEIAYDFKSNLEILFIKEKHNGRNFRNSGRLFNSSTAIEK